MGIDQGTGGTTAVIYDNSLHELVHAYRAVTTSTPREGWVEQNPQEVLASVVEAVAEALASPEQRPHHDGISAAGLANQGESVLAWDRTSGEALSPVLVWSDRRSVASLRRSRIDAAKIQALTGLRLSSYFCAPKYRWLLENNDAVASAARKGSLVLGTLDSWLLWNLSRERSILTDESTASRTLLRELHARRWSSVLCGEFGIDQDFLAPMVPSMFFYGNLTNSAWKSPVPLYASLVDQTASLYGNRCLAEGDIKITFGTGAFVYVNSGAKVTTVPQGLLASVAWSDAAHVTYAVDGGVLSAGSALEALCEQGILSSSDEIDSLIEGLRPNGYFLPALHGLGAPWWNENARARYEPDCLSKPQRAKAVIDGIAFRVRDIVEAARRAGVEIPRRIRVDGGLTHLESLMRRQADVLGVALECGVTAEATALGAAAMAAQAAGLPSVELLRQLPSGKCFFPVISGVQGDKEYDGWLQFVQRCAESDT